MQIRDRVFVVTGAASGLGAATARMIVEEGGAVVAVDLNREAGEALEQKLGARVRFAQADVTREEDAKNAVAEAAERFGYLHGLVNCAGIAPAERVVGREGPHRLDLFAKVVSVNLVGTFNMIRLAAEAMAREEPREDGERGVIVNTASVAAFDGQIGQAAYAASKGGVAAMTLPIARELAKFGIRVVTIAPGIFETPMMAGFTPEVQESLARSVPFPQRLGRPSEYAALVKHICENRMLNGETIRLDGAIRMSAK
jgi:NAD(P)-dependent dehydrogenase (short-subunit alcohol dehydrogenase family)